MDAQELSFYVLLIATASLANMVPPLAAKVFPKWDQSIDFGVTFRGKQLFGDHKTIRGFFFGTLAAGLIFLAYRLSTPHANELPVYFGFIIGFITLAGDSLKSFFKRQFSIAPGTTWIPWDQIDWIIAVSILFHFTIELPELFYIGFFSLGFIGHVLANILSYLLRINKRWI